MRVGNGLLHGLLKVFEPCVHRRFKCRRLGGKVLIESPRGHPGFMGQAIHPRAAIALQAKPAPRGRQDIRGSLLFLFRCIAHE
ncbi:hypothetical protein D3C85_1478740 [compost metagenome]